MQNQKVTSNVSVAARGCTELIGLSYVVCRYQLRKGAAVVAGVDVDQVTISSIGRRRLLSSNVSATSQRRRLGVEATMTIESLPGQDIASQAGMASAESFTEALQDAAVLVTATEIAAALDLPGNADVQASIITAEALDQVVSSEM